MSIPLSIDPNLTPMDPSISILLPVYNSASLLGDCFDSIESQTHRNYEVVAVDDGSTDGTSHLLKRRAGEDRRIRPYSFAENRGVVAALNYGLKRCRGFWIARMDADDIMNPERLERQLDYMKRNPKVDILGCRISLFRREGVPTSGQLRYQDWSNSLITDERIKQEIFAESPIMHPTFFLRNEYFRTLNGYSDRPWAEDYDLLLKALLQKATFAKLPEVLLLKRDHPNRVARTDSRCKPKAMYRAKAFYFAKHFRLQGRRLLIVGNGPSARQLVEALQREGMKIDGFVQNRDNAKKGKNMGVPIHDISLQDADAFFWRNRNAFFLLAVGDATGKATLEKILTGSGLRPGVHYYKFI